MNSGILTNEATVAQRLGVPRSVLRALRKKENGAAGVEEGAHWLRGENQAVEYTQAGIAELMRIFADSPPSNAEIEELTAAPTHVALYVARTVANKRLVLAVQELGEVKNPKASLLRVQVKNSKKMRPGMVLDLCRHVSADLYAFEGRKARRANPLVPTQGPSQQPQQ